MGSLIVIIVIAAVAFAWVRGTRRNRIHWLSQLDLPGSWDWEDHDGELELSGQLDEGRYRFRESSGTEEGNWHLEGHTLILAPDGDSQTQSYDLRYFDEGKIGVHGPGREQRIYVKIPSNVVHLHRGSKH